MANCSLDPSRKITNQDLREITHDQREAVERVIARVKSEKGSTFEILPNQDRVSAVATSAGIKWEIGALSTVLNAYFIIAKGDVSFDETEYP